MFVFFDQVNVVDHQNVDFGQVNLSFVDQIDQKVGRTDDDVSLFFAVRVFFGFFMKAVEHGQTVGNRYRFLRIGSHDQNIQLFPAADDVDQRQDIRNGFAAAAGRDGKNVLTLQNGGDNVYLYGSRLFNAAFVDRLYRFFA